MKTILKVFIILSIIGSNTLSFSQTDWTKYSENPVLEAGPSGAWDNGFVGTPTVLFDGDIYHMWYGNFVNGKHERIGYATSTDGINWNKYDDLTTTSAQYAESDPVLVKGNSGAWDDYVTAFCSVLLDHTQSIFKMWYTGGNGVGDGHIGFATSLIVDNIEDNTLTDLPRRFVLSQNYPNPFNPRTIINYELPITNTVDISIYNLLGQKITTLVSEKQEAGYHQVEWDASGYASGVYLYGIITDNGFSSTKKLLLLK